MGRQRGSVGAISLLGILWIGLTLPAGASRAASQPALRIFDVTTAHEVLASGRENACRTFGLVLVVTLGIEDLALIDHVSHH